MSFLLSFSFKTNTLSQSLFQVFISISWFPQLLGRFFERSINPIVRQRRCRRRRRRRLLAVRPIYFLSTRGFPVNRTPRRLENARTLSTGFFGYILPSAISTRSRWVDRTHTRAYRLACANVTCTLYRLAQESLFFSQTFLIFHSLLKDYLKLLISIIINIRERLLSYDSTISDIFIYGLEERVISEVLYTYRYT